MPELTGSFALRLIENLNAAADAAGQGEMRGIKMLVKLNSLGCDVIAMPEATTSLRVSSSDAGHG